LGFEEISMKELFVLRHGKAAYLDPQLDDFDRPLTLIGRQTVTILSEKIKDSKICPELVICSPARRTRETLDGLIKALPSFVKIVYEDEIYLASPQFILNKLNSLDDKFRSVLLVGHNPGLEQTLVQLAKDDPLLKHVTPLPTACFIQLDLMIERWGNLKNQCAHIKNYFLPNEPQ
jgi:phosphohistidine phosphatase